MGITISFMVQNWSENQALKKLEIQTLERIHEDLSADTASLKNECTTLEFAFRSCTQILSFNTLEEIKDSLNLFMGSQLNYTVFAKSDIGYQGMLQAGRSDLISNKELLSKIVQQYVVNYRELDEYGEIDQTFIMDQFMPFFNEEMPFIPRFDFVNNWDKAALVARGDKYLNMVRTNALIKFQIVTLYKTNIDKISDLMQAIEQELEALR